MVGAATSIIFVVTSTCFSRQTDVCHDRAHVLSQQKHAFRDKKHNCIMTNICHDKHVFVMTNMQQAYFLSQQKMCFATTNTRLSRQIFVETQLCFLLRQARFCCDKRRVLSQQTGVCQDKCVCRDKSFITTKMILLAAAANDSCSAVQSDIL